MAKITVSKCKTCKRLKEKAFLKGERCTGPKCPLVRKSTTGKKVMGGTADKIGPKIGISSKKPASIANVKAYSSPIKVKPR